MKKKKERFPTPIVPETEIDKMNRMSKVMDIYANPGTPVTYVNFTSGWPKDREYGIFYLEKHRTYHVNKINVGSSVSYVELVELPGKWFNTVLFV